jgi:hypothetical protein
MPVRIPASELYKIQADDLRNAISEFREGVLPPTFNDSTRFDLLVDGYRRFPPKAIVALAARRALGRVLSSSEFAGGESSTVFRLLVERGFEFATKVMTVGEMDATFSVGRNKEAEFVLIESRGPDRNTDYIPGLEALIRGLADLDASIEDIVVDSGVTRQLTADQRRPTLRGHRYPIRLRAVSDLSALRLDITRAVAVTGRDPEATRGGNSTKRIRLGFAEPDDLELFSIASFLAQNRGAPARRARAFTFRPGAPAPGGGGTNTRRAMEETDVTHLHYEMQQSLYGSLVAAHGPDNVSCEGETSSGRPADVIVRLPDGYELFEIKTALAPRDCVREAIGQLFEYAYWPGSPRFKALWVVGPSPIDRETQEHLDGLRERFGIPVSYRQQPVETPPS